MASQNDLFDMLDISKQEKALNDGNNVPTLKKTSTQQQQATPQSLTGIQKELYNLLGDSMPSIKLTNNKAHSGRLNSEQPCHWSKVKFKPCEDSKVLLEHWVKGSKDVTTEPVRVSKYASYNHKYSVPSFNEEEFSAFMSEEKEKSIKSDENKKISKNKENEEVGNLENKSPETALSSNADDNSTALDIPPNAESLTQKLEYEEVQHIFELVRQYDMKWVVIHDRYSYENKERTIEDIKDIFYSVCRKFFEHTDSSNGEIQTLLQYPKAREIERKNYLTRLLSRTSAEVAEEEALMIEAKKFEMAAKKTSLERDQLLQLLDTPISLDSIDITEFLTSQGLYNFYSSLMADKTRKRKYYAVPENPWMKQQQRFKTQKTKKIEDESASKRMQQQKQQQLQDQQSPQQGQLSGQKSSKSVSVEPANKKQKVEPAQPENIITQLLREFDQEERRNLGIRLHENKLSPGVFLRSTKISTFKPATQNKVQAILNEMKMPLRPVMSTFEVVKKNDEFLKKITQLLDIKKQVDKLEAELLIRK